jgi:hypothetical protein
MKTLKMAQMARIEGFGLDTPENHIVSNHGLASGLRGGNTLPERGGYDWQFSS